MKEFEVVAVNRPALKYVAKRLYVGDDEDEGKRVASLIPGIFNSLKEHGGVEAIFFNKTSEVERYMKGEDVR